MKTRPDQKYADELSNVKDTPIIDLGCGKGNNTLYLTKRGFKVIACDISDTAINLLKKTIPEAETMVFDMQDGLPFEDDIAKVIIADLSLHYFTWEKTDFIIREIRRVLIKDGLLLLRVNSTGDVNYGSGQGNEIEINFYENNGHYKRFFDKNELLKLLAGWDIKHMDEYVLNRYRYPKVLWEAAVVNR